MKSVLAITLVQRWSFIAIVVGCCWFSGCTDATPGKYENGKCYEGRLIRAFCPGIAVVSVSNANIGVDWTWNGNTYPHAVTITNFQLTDSLSSNMQVYFTIDTDAADQQVPCRVDVPCQRWLYDQSAPDERVCVKYASTTSCYKP